MEFKAIATKDGKYLLAYEEKVWQTVMNYHVSSMYHDTPKKFNSLEEVKAEAEKIKRKIEENKKEGVVIKAFSI